MLQEAIHHSSIGSWEHEGGHQALRGSHRRRYSLVPPLLGNGAARDRAPNSFWDARYGQSVPHLEPLAGPVCCLLEGALRLPLEPAPQSFF